MPLLEAFLALALTMLSLAMIASLLVEFFHRFAGTRAEDFKGMLEQIYERDLRPIVEAELAAELRQANKPLEQYKEEFINQLATNPVLLDKSSSLQGPIASALKPLTSLSTEDFFKRLAHTEIGRKMKAKGDKKVDEYVESLARAYDAFGAATTDLFKRRAQIISFGAGLIVAFGLNVNALFLFQQYLDEPIARAKVIAQADSISAQYKARIDKSDLKEFKNKEEAEEYVKSFKNDIANLGKSNVTIGYSWAVPPGSLLKSAESASRQEWIDAGLWLFGVIGTGLLIGLGGPFWFDIVRKLTDVIQVARGGSAADNVAAPARAVAVSDSMQVYKDTFKKAGATSTPTDAGAP